MKVDPNDRIQSSDTTSRSGRSKSRARKGGADDKPQKPKSSHQTRNKWLKRLFVWGLTLMIWCGIGVGGIVAYYAIDLPDIDQMTEATRRPSIQFISAEGANFAAYGDLYGHTLDIKDLPPDLINSVLATEDRRFFSHIGVDFFGLARAAYTNWQAGRVVQGGSTVTQQLAKILFLTPERSMKRKIQELLMALWLEQRFTKQQLLTLYLNRVYLGSGTYGVDAAARRYFDKSARYLNLYESAVLAGLLKAPSRYSPLNDPETSHKRTLEVLQNLVEAGYNSVEDVRTAASFGIQGMVERPAPAGRYFADWIVAEMNKIPEIRGRDVVVHTTMDLTLQNRAEAILKRALKVQGPKLNASQGAIVLMSPDGAVRALVGGNDYDKSPFNRATQGFRQPGSAFKPFVYAAAFERGYSPWDTVEDAPIRLGKWSPGNYTNRYEGPISIRHAVANSTNTVAVRMIDAVGVDPVIQLSHKLGISSKLGRDASLSLGTSEISLLELTNAFAGFANGGYGIEAFGIEKITDPNGQILWKKPKMPTPKVLSDRTVAHMHNVLQAVIAEGTGKNARLDRPSAGKSGTTQDYRDAWFMGFTADYVGGVWLGNDDQRIPMKKVTGGGLPATIWKDVMLAAHEGLPPRNLPTPYQAPEVAPSDGPGQLIEALITEPAKKASNALDDLFNSLFGN